MAAGDVVTVLERPAHGVTAADLMAAMTGDRELLARVAPARSSLGVRGREWFDRIAGAAAP